MGTGRSPNPHSLRQRVFDFMSKNQNADVNILMKEFKDQGNRRVIEKYASYYRHRNDPPKAKKQIGKKTTSRKNMDPKTSLTKKEFDAIISEIKDANQNKQQNTPQSLSIPDINKMTDDLLLSELYQIIADPHTTTPDRLRAIQIAIPLMSKKNMIKDKDDSDTEAFDFTKLAGEPFAGA